MPDTNWSPGESNKTRDNYNLSDVKAGMVENRSRRDANRSLIQDAFPSQGAINPSHEGSQSWAPNAETTPP